MKVRSNIYTKEHGMMKKKIHFVLDVSVEFTEEEKMLFDRVNAWEYPVYRTELSRDLWSNDEIPEYVYTRLKDFKEPRSWRDNDWDHPHEPLTILKELRKNLPIAREKLKMCGEQVVDV